MKVWQTPGGSGQRFLRPIVAVLAVAAAGQVSPARGQLVITPTFDSTITSDPNAAAIEGVINQAIAVYKSTFTDSINVSIDFREMSTGLGESNKTLYFLPYSTFRSALQADATSAADATALAHLSAGATNPVTGGTNISITTAEIRAVGIAGSFPPIGSFDGTIGLNTHLTDVGSPGTSGQYSLLGVVEHEIDEVLGLGSSLGGPFQSNPAPEDLFRYDASGNRSYTTSSTAKAYFSIDGVTQLAQFDNQNDGGDWGDWQSNPRGAGVAPQVQDAFATPGAHPVLGPNEITALDVIGYNVASVPEPGCLGLLGVGSVAAGCFLRWRRR